MRLNISSDEAYPYLYITEPFFEHDDRTREVPDDLGQAVLAAQRQLHEAEQALLLWLRDEGGLSPESDIISDHLDEDGDADNPDHH